MSSETYWTADPAELLRVGDGFELSKTDSRAHPGFDGDKADGEQLLGELDGKLTRLQEQLFAESRTGGKKRVLLVLQAMDTAGKGGIVNHVMGQMNPQGVQLKSFKAPTPEEQSYDFLWRIEKEVPAAGMVGVFDRSHYEDVLIHRVHRWVDAGELERRYRAINEFEARQAAAGTKVVKVMLHISRDEQRERLLARLEDPAKRWKYSGNDLKERAFWEDYMDAYQAAFEQTSSELAPWHVVPADKKWYARIAVQQLLLHALEGLALEWPVPDLDVDMESELVRRS